MILCNIIVFYYLLHHQFHLTKYLELYHEHLHFLHLFSLYREMFVMFSASTRRLISFPKETPRFPFRRLLFHSAVPSPNTVRRRLVDDVMLPSDTFSKRQLAPTSHSALEARALFQAAPWRPIQPQFLPNPYCSV